MPLTRISSSTTITNSRRKATDRTGEWRRTLLQSPGSDYTEREGIVMSVITGATKQVQVIHPQQRKHLRGKLVTALILGGPAFLRSILNNIFVALVVVPVQSGLGLLLALLVNQKLKGRNLFRTIYFSPVVTSMVVISTVWTFLYDKNVGLVNHMLKTVSFGAIGPVNWLGSPSTAMWAIIIMSVWQG